MIDYKIVKYCRGCKERFVVERGQVRVIYCTECQKKVLKEKKKNLRKNILVEKQK